jgi:hypothetical protein
MTNLGGVSTGRPTKRIDAVEKGNAMNYTSPTLDRVGRASELIQGSTGNSPDSDGESQQFDGCSSKLEEE